MKLFGSNIKKFRKRKLQKNLYISGNGNPKKASYILGNETFQSTPRKMCYISGNQNPEKISYISGGTSKAPKTNISYISP